MRTTDFASLLSKYLLSYLPCQRGVSDNTLASYEAAFSRLLQYCEEERGLPVRKITVETLSPDLIEGYLNWLCEKQKNSASTRNQRLSAIKAFFKFTRRENPRYIYACERILQIPTKKCPTPVLQYLSYEEIKEMLEKPNPCTEKGFRDLLILCLLYDTGARVSELLDLTVGDIHFGRYARVQLTGKGNKSREVPLSAKTADLLKSYISALCRHYKTSTLRSWSSRNRNRGTLRWHWSCSQRAASTPLPSTRTWTPIPESFATTSATSASSSCRSVCWSYWTACSIASSATENSVKIHGYILTKSTCCSSMNTVPISCSRSGSGCANTGPAARG